MASSSAPANSIDGARYISLETFRKDGSGVKTPVWFADIDGKLAVMTGTTAYKVKRIRNNPKVRVAACNANGKQILGPWLEGTAREVEGDEARRVDEALSRKYTWQRTLFGWFARLTGRIGQRVFLEITLATS